MKKILCPTDFSESSMNAVHYANEIAKIERAILILFHAYRFHPVPDSGIMLMSEALVSMEDDAKARINEISDELNMNLGMGDQVRYKSIIKHGLLIEEINNTVKKENIDLIIMGTHGAEGLRKVLFGTITAGIIEQAKCPVLVIPAGHRYSPIREIVYATQLNRDETSDLAYTIELARYYNAHISLFHIAGAEVDENDLVSRLETLISNSNYKKISRHLNIEPDVLHGIQEFSKRVKADIIIMAPHRRNIYQKIFSKSLTGEISYSTTIPILALHKQNILVSA